jgi:dolichyl-phosphate-mannose-protein mannosyltransferase
VSRASADPARHQNLLAAALVAVVSSLTLFIGLGAPTQPIWDENYYLTSTQRYLEGTAQFASHPPLGLMLIAAGAALSDDHRGVDAHRLAAAKAVAGKDVPRDYQYLRVRLASATFGVIGAVLFFLLMLSLAERTLAALLLSNLYIFENAFITQFRAGHLDAFQMVFVLLALLLFTRGVARGRAKVSEDFALGLVCGLAAMVRLNGVFLIPLGLMLATHRLWRGGGARVAWLRAARDGATMTLGFLLAAVAVMIVHVAVGRHPPDLATPAGQRDASFVSPTYAAYLDGARPLSPVVVVAAANDYRRYVAADFDGMARADANGSSPIVWPLHAGTINYRWDSDGVTTRYLQLAGNRVGWAVSLAGLIAAAALVLSRGWTDPRRRHLAVMLLAAYGGFLVLNIVLSQHRVMYLYHYFPGLLLGFVLAALSFTEARARWPELGIWRGGLAAVAALHLACFAFEAPLTYHRPLSHGACEARNLGQTIVACR